MKKKEYFFSLLIFLLFFFSIEICLRFIYKNPYDISEAKQLASLEQNIPGLIDKLKNPNPKPTSKEVVMRIGENYEILSGKPIDPKLLNAHFIGGSTTKCHCVPEGKRWPDLVTGYNTHNHGILGRNLLENYFNLLFYIDEGIVQKGDTIFLMHAVNDLSKVLKKYKSSEIEHEYNPFDINRYYKSKKVKGFLSKYSYLYGLIREASHKKKIQKRAKAQKSMLRELSNSQPNSTSSTKNKSNQAKEKTGLEEKEFEYYLGLIKKDLRFRRKLLDEFKNLCEENNLELIILTQPNSFLDEFTVQYKHDHNNPKINQQKLSNKQARILLDSINQQNINFAEKHQLLYIDLNKAFLKHNPNPLFRDSVHYTEEGAKLFADIVNKELNASKK